MLEYQIIKTFFGKDYVQIWSEEVFVIRKVKNTGSGHMLFVILKSKRLLERFTKKNRKKTNQKGFTVEKVKKRKGDKLYVKWKSYDGPFHR